MVKTAGNAADGANYHINEPGGTVTFTVSITNTSTTDSITIDTIDDDVYGDLTDPLNPDIANSTCTVPQTLAVGDPAYTCTFDGAVSGNTGDVFTDKVTGSGLDDDDEPVTDTDDAKVELDDVQSSVDVVKTAGNAADGANLPHQRAGRDRDVHRLDHEHLDHGLDHDRHDRRRRLRRPDRPAEPGHRQLDLHRPADPGGR